MDSVIRAEALTRYLPGEVPIILVEDASIEVKRGECVAITGPSGSGKSSLLYLLGLLDMPTSGCIWVHERTTSSFDDDQLADLRLSEIGLVFQSHFLLPEFSALENVMIPMQRLEQMPEDVAMERGLHLLDELGLGTEADRYPHQLSGGQSQRVAIARALANNPALILADEPTGNLDTVSGANVQKIMLSLAHEHGRAVIIVTHDAKFAASADRIVTLVDGRVISQ